MTSFQHPLTLLLLIIAFGISYYNIMRAKTGKLPLLKRKIPAVDAIEQAVGRATELGRPIIFTPGLSSLETIDAPQTLAGLSILSYVSKLAAKTKTPIFVGVSKATILPLAQEIVKMACLEAGVPEAVETQHVEYLSDQQFAYAAGYIGIMAREKAVSNIFTGTLWAESLIFAESGHAAGCFQIGGTAVWTQMAFIVPTCDFVLLGEELMAAGAILSNEPEQISTIVSHDYLRLIAVAIILAAFALILLNVNVLSYLMGG
ncbi:MAG: DUF6754 domain-containing protein [Nitrososphaeria archaeon]